MIKIYTSMEDERHSIFELNALPKIAKSPKLYQ